MTVELADAPGSGPFVWPEGPKDWSPWRKSEFLADRQEEEALKQIRKQGKSEPKMDGDALKKQAERLLKGEEKWRPGWDLRDRRKEVRDGDGNG